MTDEWLSLGDAAQLLGVHPSTVRSWSNRGFLPVHRTQGGHRRYLRSEVELWLQAQRDAGSADISRVIMNALRNTRFQINEGRLHGQNWYGKLDETARLQYRLSGRALLNGLIGCMSMDDETMRSEAAALGYEYAARGRRYGMSSAEAVQAYLFFRTFLMDAMLEAYEAAAIPSPQAWTGMFRKITAFTDQILLQLLETFDAYQRANL
jgi:excisionase family DNA binding protein